MQRFGSRGGSAATDNRHGRHCYLTLAACTLLLATEVCAQVQVLTQHNDSGRTGANLSETILTPDVLRSGRFGRLGHYVVDGKIFAQPLYTNENRKGTLYIATAQNLVYAFDADDPFDPTRPALRPRWVYDAGSHLVARSEDVYP